MYTAILGLDGTNVCFMTELTFDEFVAALVTISLKRKMSNYTLGDIKAFLEDIHDEIDMKKVSDWIEENNLALINYSEYGENFCFAADGDTLEPRGNDLVKRKFKNI